MKIIEKKWRSALHTIGFIAYDTGFEGEWNAVVGYNPDGGISEDIDAQYIAENGAKLSWQEARILFPHLDICKYKYAPTNFEISVKTIDHSVELVDHLMSIDKQLQETDADEFKVKLPNGNMFVWKPKEKLS